MIRERGKRGLPDSDSPARWWRTPALSLILTVYFVTFCRTSLGAHFASDDMPNIAKAWYLPAWKLLLAPFAPFLPCYRPLPGWLLVPIFHLFGLNPVPYRVAMLLFVLAIAFLLRSLASRLGANEWAAWIAALIACYHVGINNLYYSTAFIYDVLCCFFYISALLYYVTIRQRGVLPNYRQMAVFAWLSLFALESKEMAVTLPVMVLIYECLYHSPLPWQPRRWTRWVAGPGRCVAVGVALNLLFIWGNVYGSDVIHNPAYAPRFTMERVWAFQIESMGDLCEKWQYFDPARIVALWCLIFYLAWRRPRPVLRFAALLLLLSPLPIEFLVGRVQGCLYIPMLAWALFVAVVFVDIAGGVAGFLAREPLLRHLRREWLEAAMVAAGLVFWAWQNADLKKKYVDPVTANLHPKTWEGIRIMKELHPRVRPGSMVVFLDDPLGNVDMEFIAELWFHDHSISVWTNHPPLPPEQIAKADYVFDYRGGHLVQVR